VNACSLRARLTGLSQPTVPGRPRAPAKSAGIKDRDDVGDRACRRRMRPTNLVAAAEMACGIERTNG